MKNECIAAVCHLVLCSLSLLLSKTPGTNYMDVVCILMRKKKRIRTKPTTGKPIPSRKSQTSASAKPWCVGPHSAPEFQRLVRNYLFCWTLAGINHPHCGWCQLRSGVMQRGAFSILSDTSQPSCPLFTPTLLSDTVSITFFFNGDLILEVQGCIETNVLCSLSPEQHCLPNDFSSPHMLSKPGSASLSSLELQPIVTYCQKCLLKIILSHIIALLRIYLCLSPLPAA